MKNLIQHGRQGPVRPGRQAQSGFTLVELMIVIAILAILALVSAPAFQGFIPKYRVNAAVRSLASQMNLLRLQAVSENTPIRATFAADGKSIALEYVDISTTPPTVLAAHDDSPITLADAGSDYEHVIIGRNASGAPLPNSTNASATNRFSFGAAGSDQVIFLPNGTSNVSGEFYLSPVQVIGSADPKDDKMTRAIEVSLGGLISIYRYVNDSPTAPTIQWREL